MTQRAFESKKNFVRQTWSRCVCEVAVIRYDSGFLRRVDVTGLELYETAQAILDALSREAA